MVDIHAANTHDTIAGGDVFKEATLKYPALYGLLKGFLHGVITSDEHQKIMKYQ
jgi:hypothetical protein